MYQQTTRELGDGGARGPTPLSPTTDLKKKSQFLSPLHLN